MDPIRGLVKAVRDGDDLQASIAAFHAAAKKAKADDRNAMLAALDDVVRDAPPERAGPIAILAGAIVELGGDPRAFPGAVFEQLLDLLRTIRGPEDEKELPDAYYELERGAMACLSRSPDLRATLPQKEALLEHTLRYSERYGFLGKMIRVLDQEPLVVLHPSTSRGFRFVMSGIADNFQLHTLLLAALAGKRKNDIPGKRPSARAIAAAEGGDPSNAAVESDWQLANWFALREGGAIDTKDYDKSWIWNEGVPADIALFEGTRVVLVGPSTIHRSWSSGRVFSGMHGKLDRHGPMARDEVDDLLGGMLR
jgi:hypothetical protein